MKFAHYLTAFVAGFIALSLEIMGFRVLAPHFGYSIYVFGSLIGLILLALAIGYWGGGYLSGRRVKAHRFFIVLLLAGFYLMGAALSFDYLLQALERFHIIPGTLLATFALWAFPMAAFAAVSPYLVGLQAAKEDAGRSSGSISAAGTLGGIAGTFLTSFYLLPAFGTHATFILNGCIAILLPLAWLSAFRKRWLFVLLLPLCAVRLMPAAPLPSGVVYAKESAYSRLEVVDRGDFFLLRTDVRSGTAYSAMTKDGSLPPFLLYNLFALPAAEAKAQHGLLLGLGAGTLPRIHEVLNPGLRLTGVEIDPAAIEAGEKFFGLGDRKNLDSIVVADARPFLKKSKETYDLIEMDIFRETEIPFYLVSREFFALTKARLGPEGVFMMNVYDPTRDHVIQKKIANTVAAVYPETYVVPAGVGSFFLVGSMNPLGSSSFSGPAAQDEFLKKLAAYFHNHAEPVGFLPEEGIFTDDRAPIETLYLQNLLDAPAGEGL